MKVGDLVTTIESAQRYNGADFGPVLVIGKRIIAEEEVELLFDNGEVDWYPAWMLKVVE
mgnify:CR=1